MAEQKLRDWHILVVEDEYLLAADLESGLSEAGAVVIGPVATVEGALDAIKAEDQLDGVILDVNLSGVLAYPIADLLAELEVPFVFTTGYDQDTIPPRFEHVPRCEKPYNLAKLEHAIVRACQREIPARPPL